MDHRLGYVPFGGEDARALEDYLNRKGAQGWALERIYLGCVARFSRCESGRQYCVRPHRRGNEESGYVQLHTAAGWDRVAELRGMDLFAARPVCDPVPLPEEEAKAPIWGHILGSVCVLLLVALLLGVNWGRESGAGWSPASELLYSAHTPFLLLAAASLLIYTVWSILRQLRCRRRRMRGKEPPAGQLSPWLRGTLNRLTGGLMELCVAAEVLEMVLLLLAGYSGDRVTEHRPELQAHPIVMAETLGQDPAGVYYLSYRPVWSPQIQGERYVELLRTDEGYVQIYCSRFDCLTEFLAGVLTCTLRREAGESGDICGGVVDFSAADLGFDESWAAEDGSFLLLRQGTTVALVGMHTTASNRTADLREPAHCAAAAERLGLEYSLQGD